MKIKSLKFLPIPDTDVASYLGLKGNQLCMAQSGKYSSRHLNDEVNSKHANLILTYQQQSAVKLQTPTLKKMARQLASRCKELYQPEGEDLAWHRTRLKKLGAQLQDMREEEQALVDMIKTLDYLLATWPKDKAHRGDRLWAEVQLDKVEKRIKKVDFLAQLHLEGRVIMEQATVHKQETMQQQLSKQLRG